MSPNYIDFPERSPELRTEVERILATDTARAAEVHLTSLEETQARRGGSMATNETAYFLPALLDGRIPEAPGIRGGVAARLRSWLKKKPMSPALRADFEAQLEAIAAYDAAGSMVTSKRRYEVPDDTDQEVLSRARREQTRLRDYLLQGRAEAPCDICGRVLPTELLVAAHIVPRRDLGNGEMLQFDRIAMIACQLGCDRLFELGYLTVDDEGLIEVRPVVGEPAETLEGLAGRACSAHNAVTAPAFAVHRSARLPAG